MSSKLLTIPGTTERLNENSNNDVLNKTKTNSKVSLTPVLDLLGGKNTEDAKVDLSKSLQPENRQLGCLDHYCETALRLRNKYRDPRSSWKTMLYGSKPTDKCIASSTLTSKSRPSSSCKPTSPTGCFGSFDIDDVGSYGTKTIPQQYYRNSCAALESRLHGCVACSKIASRSRPMYRYRPTRTLSTGCFDNEFNSSDADECRPTRYNTKKKAKPRTQIGRGRLPFQPPNRLTKSKSVTGLRRSLSDPSCRPIRESRYAVKHACPEKEAMRPIPKKDCSCRSKHPKATVPHSMARPCNMAQGQTNSTSVSLNPNYITQNVMYQSNLSDSDAIKGPKTAINKAHRLKIQAMKAEPQVKYKAPDRQYVMSKSDVPDSNSVKETRTPINKAYCLKIQALKAVPQVKYKAPEWSMPERIAKPRLQPYSVQLPIFSQQKTADRLKVPSKHRKKKRANQIIHEQNEAIFQSRNHLQFLLRPKYATDTDNDWFRKGYSYVTKFDALNKQYCTKCSAIARQVCLNKEYPFCPQNNRLLMREDSTV